MTDAERCIPTALSLAGPGTLIVDWSDGRRCVYDTGELRRNCPCATCNARRGRSPADENVPEGSPPVTIQAMSPVGNYAYKIVFSDQHSTGIYPLDLLRALGTEEAS